MVLKIEDSTEYTLVFYASVLEELNDLVVDILEKGVPVTAGENEKLQDIFSLASTLNSNLIGLEELYEN